MSTGIYKKVNFKCLILFQTFLMVIELYESEIISSLNYIVCKSVNYVVCKLHMFLTCLETAAIFIFEGF